MYILKFLIVFLFISIIGGIIVQVSSPFDPFRLECPNRHGIMKLTIQRIESVGGVRSDQMISSYCESLAKLFPSSRDGSSPNHEEKCRWTEPTKIPGDFAVDSTCKNREYISGIVRQEINQYGFLCCSARDRKRGNCETKTYPLPTADNPDVTIEKGSQLLSGFGFKDNRIFAEHCDFDVLSQKEIDIEFIADAKAKLDKWFEADLKNRTSQLVPKDRTSSSKVNKKPEEKLPILTSPTDNRLPVIKSSNTADQLQKKVIGPPAITPSFAQLRNSFTRPTVISPQFNRITQRPPNEKSVSSVPSPDVNGVRKELVEKFESVVENSNSRPQSNNTRIIQKPVPSSTTRRPSPPPKSVGPSSKLASNSSTHSPTTPKSTSSTATSKTTHKPTSASLRTTTTSETTTIKSSTTEPKSTISIRLRSTTAKRPTKATTESAITTRKTTITRTTTSLQTTTGNDEGSSEESEPRPVARLLSFPRLPLHREDLDSFNSFPTSQPGQKFKGSSSFKSASKSTPTPTKQQLPSVPNDENDVEYVDQDLFSKKPTDKPSDSVEYYYYYEDGQPASAKPRASSTTLKPIDKINALTAGSTITRTNAPQIVVTEKTTLSSQIAPQISSTGKVLCDTRQAATSSATGLVIACGQGTEVWVPPRCPKETFCLESANSNFRVCCSAEFAVI